MPGMGEGMIWIGNTLLPAVDVMWTIGGFVAFVLVAYVVLRIIGDTYGE